MSSKPSTLAFAQCGGQPLVTVAMPVYNAGKHLRLAVLSIVKQTFTNWELLIIDDGSTDNALQDVADINDARIRIYRDGLNKGLAARLNECIDLAQGKYLARMDQDDTSYPARFERQVAALLNDPTLDLLATRAITVDENNAVTGLFPCALSHNDICAQPWRGFYFPHPTWMGKTEWFRKYRYTLPGPYFCEDQDLLLRSYRDSRFATLGEILFAYRIRSTVNWQKLSRTRRTVLSIQLRQFVSTGQWLFVFLAVVAFVAKMSRDLSKTMGRGDFRLGCDNADTDVAFEWHRILDFLATEIKVL